MTIYCDRLTLRVVLAIAGKRLMGRLPSGARVALLDGPAGGPAGALGTTLLPMLGVAVAEAEFFAGHLTSASGESLGPFTFRESFRLADAAAKLVCGRSPLLRQMNDRWPRNTVQLHIGKQLWPVTMGFLFRVFAADALARRDGGEAALFIAWPSALPRELRSELCVAIPVRAVGTKRPAWKAGRAAIVPWRLRQWARGLSARRRKPQTGPPATPALLVLQEDNLSLDHSYRGQPHWLEPGAAPFRTVVLRTGRFFDAEISDEERKAAGLEILELDDLAAAEADVPVARELRQWTGRLTCRGVFALDGAEASAAAAAARLATSAAELAQLATARGVTAFLTCENYMLHADAMHLVAPALGIATLSYQYSNMPNPSLPMVTTADRMVVFSPKYHDTFTWPGYPPPAFVEGGYVYSSSFPLVKSRAAERRQRLHAAGAAFIAGLFDENVQPGKYGWISPHDYEADLLFLLERVQRDPTFGLIIKTQFHHTMKKLSPGLQAALAAGTASGRVELPSRGRHRNAVLPCEVAAASDVVIGHSFAGTASLEAALIGCRSIMVNSTPTAGAHDGLYRRADLLFPSLEQAFEAIDALRAGDPSHQRLGDWSPILSEFDPFRDDRSAARLRAVIQAAVMGGSVRPGVGLP